MEQYVERHGFPPTIREIGQATSINSTSVVNYNLNKLVQAGYLSRSGRVSRGIRLVRGAPGEDGVGGMVRPITSVLHVPTYGHIVASEPVSVPEDVGHYAQDTIEVPPWMLRGVDLSEVFALRVKGDSMIDAMIRQGDIVLLRNQQVANNGDMVAVWLLDPGETTLKYFFDEGSRIRLQPAHPTMKPIYVDPSNVQVQGKVLSVIRQV